LGTAAAEDATGMTQPRGKSRGWLVTVVCNRTRSLRSEPLREIDEWLAPYRAARAQ